MEIKKIFEKIRKQEEEKEYFFALLLEEEIVKSAVWTVEDDTVKILRNGAVSYTHLTLPTNREV